MPDHPLPRRRRALVLVGLVLAALVLAGCGGDDDSGDDASPADGVGGPVDVSIVDFGFEPAELAVPAGTTVRWTNDGAAPHTVTGGILDSGDIAPGDTFQATLVAPGTIEYVCTIHPQMTATIIVE
ncbi:MAG TPA: cupredoxin domain-containing protein [Acidimicrobiales bacterium]|nr:cupredoxin domain-containing protein [Acidimicrobiales bacterium]